MAAAGISGPMGMFHVEKYLQRSSNLQEDDGISFQTQAWISGIVFTPVLRTLKNNNTIYEKNIKHDSVSSVINGDASLWL